MKQDHRQGEAGDTTIGQERGQAGGRLLRAVLRCGPAGWALVNIAGFDEQHRGDTGKGKGKGSHEIKDKAAADEVTE